MCLVCQKIGIHDVYVPFNYEQGRDFGHGRRCSVSSSVLETSGVYVVLFTKRCALSASTD